MREAIETGRLGIAAMTGLEVESVSSVSKSETGYLLTVEVVEASHVPSDRDILCSITAMLDPSGEVQEFKRDRRYRRQDV